jgi:pimeloyl-ACP methyl ester carboxylesterase
VIQQDVDTADEIQVVRTRAGGDVQVHVRGSGPAIVWVAGLGDDHAGWATQVNDFADDFTCVSFDNRGVGGSTVLPGPYSMSDFADDAHDVVSALGLGPVAAVGSSMGGAICQRWALDYPDDVSRMVLACTWGERDAYLGLLLRHWVALIDAGQPERLAESLFLGCYSGSYLHANPGIIDEFLAAPLPDLAGLKAAVQACLGHARAQRDARHRGAHRAVRASGVRPAAVLAQDDPVRSHGDLGEARRVRPSRARIPAPRLSSAPITRGAHRPPSASARRNHDAGTRNKERRG